ncbi:MAG: hypothetical protein QNI84_14780 [Henriciella sp.]|nr:hypothetical protein [Henriciella sp.]
METALVFWILLGVIAFAFALAVQMRVVIALVLRRALKAWKPEFDDRVLANDAVIAAAGQSQSQSGAEPVQQSAAAHLIETYPNPLRHLRLARRVSLVAPVMLIVLLALGRFRLGVI